MDEWRAVLKKIMVAPATVTDFDFEIIESFEGPAGLQMRIKQRRHALATTRVLPVSVAEKVRVERLATRAAKRVAPAHPTHEPPVPAPQPPRPLPVMDPTTTYDTAAFEKALERFHDEPRTLTDADIAQLYVVSAELAVRANDQRAGVPEAEIPHADTPVPLGAFVKTLRDHVAPIQATHRYRIRELLAKTEKLEQRLEMLEGQRPHQARTDDSEVIALKARLEALEQRPSLEYYGVWKAGTTYKRGAAVTWAGSCWVAMESTAAKPGEAIGPSRAWVLAVKAGRDAARVA
jgi:hypothetical protein